MATPQRITWDANQGRFVAHGTNPRIVKAAPNPPQAGALQIEIVDHDPTMDMLTSSMFKASLSESDGGCTPNDIALARNLLVTYLSTDVYEESVVKAVWEYLARILKAVGFDNDEDIENSLMTKGDHAYNNITNDDALSIRAVLAALKLDRLAMILRFPFSRKQDRKNAENLCKIWLQSVFHKHSSDTELNQTILYDLYSAFETMFRVTPEMKFTDIPEDGQAEGGFMNSWAQLNYRPGQFYSPTMSRSGSRSGSHSGSRRTSVQLTVNTGSHHNRNRSGSGMGATLGSPLSPIGGPPKSPIRRNRSSSTLFVGSRSPNRPTTPNEDDGEEEAKESEEWFIRHYNPNITPENVSTFRIWKAVYAHLIAGARVEYLVTHYQLDIIDVFTALSNNELVQQELMAPVFIPPPAEDRPVPDPEPVIRAQLVALPDLAHYIYIRDGMGTQEGIANYQWAESAQAGFELLVSRLRSHCSGSPGLQSHQSASDFLGSL